MISRRQINDFVRKLTPGTKLVCLDNTRIVNRAGMVVRVVHPGKQNIRLEVVEPRGPRIMRGDVVWLKFPSRCQDFIAVTDDTISYHLDREPSADAATWQIVKEES